MLKYLILACFISYSLQINNCATTRKICKKCIEGYTPVALNTDEIKCINTSSYEAIQKVKEHCIQGDPDSKTCELCIRDYFLNEKNNCTEMSHCSRQSGNNCESCKSPYALDKGTSQCVKKPFCNSVEGEKCVDCDDYFYPDENGNCIRIPDKYCYKGNSKQCSNCDSGYFVNSESKCQKIPFDHCKHGDAVKCETCQVYYYMKNSQCVPAPNLCKVYSYNSLQEKCLLCDYYFHAEGTNCVPNPEHCIDYFNGACKICDDDYYLENKICKYMTIKNCETLEDDSTHCKTCKEGYILNGDKTQCNDLCKEYDDICYECDNNYVSYDYGKTCEVVEPDNEPSSQSNSIDLNLFIILLFGYLIL